MPSGAQKPLIMDWVSTRWESVTTVTMAAASASQGRSFLILMVCISLSSDLLARVRRPLRAVRLLLELGADVERRVQELGIDDFGRDGEPVLARRILERHEVLDEP